ncbi:MAG: sulfurtransferase complex subunit TusB [Anaerolineae bacterium]|nr:MAG: sulfurtransferase complex subunit TusB [Anaerolineae bacterium]
MLYTVNKSPFASPNLERCLQVAPAGSPILLYEDGVYAAAAGTAFEERLHAALQAHPIYALQSDLEARGLSNLVEGVRVITYEDFVDLVIEHNVVPWL